MRDDRYDPWADIGRRYPRTAVRHKHLDGLYGLVEMDGTIVPESRLTQAQRRSTLAHEIAHLDRGDVCLHEAYPDARRQEHKAEEAAHAEAARRLIHIEDLAYALCVHGEGDLDRVAEDLWVDLDILLARIDHLHPAERGAVRLALDAKEDAA